MARRPPLSPFHLLTTPQPGRLARPAVGGNRPSNACAHTHPPTPGERATYDLNAAELLVVGAVRAWVAPLLNPGRDSPDWREFLALAGVDDSGTHGFDLLMGTLASTARRPIDVRCCACPSIGDDEAAMLRFVSAVQVADARGAFAVLTQWLHDEDVPIALHGAVALADAMQRAGHALPDAPGLDRPPPGVTIH